MLRATLFALIATLLTCLAAAQTLQPQTADILFTHARLLDGSGNPWRYADVAVQGDRISFVGDTGKASFIAREVVDLNGKLYLAPGFIDTHTHTARGLSSPERKENLNSLMQGVTTV